MDKLFKIGNKILKIGNKIVTVSDSPVPPVDYVTIGDQIWKSKNLAIDDGGTGIYTQTVNYGQGDVLEYYYTWDAAVRVAGLVQGWHLPSRDEWGILAHAVGSSEGTKLKSTYGWTSGNGTDDYGFSAFPAGMCFSGAFYSVGTIVNFWTSYASSSFVAAARGFDQYSSITADNYYTMYSFSVRLIKDSV